MRKNRNKIKIHNKKAYQFRERKNLKKNVKRLQKNTKRSNNQFLSP